VSGLAYYISPPHTFADIARDPIHAVFYLLFILASCALFSKVTITCTECPRILILNFCARYMVLLGKIIDHICPFIVVYVDMD